jgi:hypothetical protein
VSLHPNPSLTRLRLRIVLLTRGIVTSATTPVSVMDTSATESFVSVVLCIIASEMALTPASFKRMFAMCSSNSVVFVCNACAICTASVSSRSLQLLRLRFRRLVLCVRLWAKVSPGVLPRQQCFRLSVSTFVLQRRRSPLHGPVCLCVCVVCVSP